VVFGQDKAIEALSSAIKLARAGLREPEKPIGNYLFAGPTGVGKTEVAKQLASILGVELLRFDMSEYMEKHAVSRLIGAPPGYVGYEQGGALTEAVRRRPYQVILLDEVEKAHPDVFNLLLQLLDEGRLTDSHARTVDFRNTLVILTSNLGANHLAELPQDAPASLARPAVMEAVRSAFRPEFINRLDEILLFNRLTRADMDHIVALQLQRIEGLLATQQLRLAVTPEARTWLADQGYDPLYGARPLKRVLQRYVQNPLAEAILAGQASPHSVITFTMPEPDPSSGSDVAHAPIMVYTT
jgi:ATP-dependent Clp protease ATP-binding subunit ClpB